MFIRCSLGFIHVCCLVTSNKIVAARSLHSIHACSTHAVQAHAVQASRCNYYIHHMYICMSMDIHVHTSFSLQELDELHEIMVELTREVKVQYTHVHEL